MDNVSKRVIDWLAIVSLLFLISVPWIVLLDPLGVAVWPRLETITQIQTDVDVLLEQVAEIKRMLKND